ncbi:hypothetical protein FOXG_03007 [Fusarium oxysporum f. sp. lycopersici 4287]|uniref:Pre-rRNA-processing protein TSR2 n=1 Tax=Fusarium oxysporum f. sp. lycopersici (strain 4287 / CBS 123668 / FGSC 9935 / NRRL 34936) TaxID=426428 RepID=A0A0J9WIL3_FUSO4|nr:hypothetical protein FOXG_03007 [Fusarium oxysporum f. sp. lycopersici 4287]KNA98731.1 hypothetical protein FOXG_03007 [Fusarium oxysporum f. sp. lycopersici 4287]
MIKGQAGLNMWAASLAAAGLIDKTPNFLCRAIFFKLPLQTPPKLSPQSWPLQNLHRSSAAERQSEFEQAVAYALHLWPALTLSVQNGWGGPDSADKRDWFAGAVADLFPEYTDTPPKNGKVPEDPDLEEVETVLLQIMVDEFEVNVDDDSGTEVAGNILRARASCTLGTFDEVKALRTRWLNRKGTKVEGIFKKAEDADQDTDWESDEDDSEDDEGGADVEMDEAPPLVAVPKEKPQPQVDEDGFTMVTKKKK